MVHGHIQDQVPNVQGYLSEPINELPQGLSLLMANVDQGNRGQVMWSTGSELCLELGHQGFKAVDGVWRELRKPTQSSFFQ